MTEIEKLRGLLGEVRVLLANSSYKISGTAAFLHSIDAALSQQAEQPPGSRGLSFVQEVPAHCDRIVWRGRYYHLPLADTTRPAQTEWQPAGWQSIVLHASELADMVLKGDAPQTAHRTARVLLSMLAAPIAQTAPQPEQSGLVEALEWYADCGKAGVKARVALAAYRAALSAPKETPDVPR